MSEEAINCGSCGMRFDVRLPANKGSRTAAETTRCAVTGCGRRYWHQTSSSAAGYVALVGVYPNDPDAFASYGRDPNFP